jgi:hypothetical protein
VADEIQRRPVESSNVTRSDAEALPFLPRYLGRPHAALYVGVSVDVFDDEVRAGLWPAPRRRGGKGGKLTWDRILLDRAADRDSGLLDVPAKAPEHVPEIDVSDPAFQEALARLKSRVRGKAATRN